MGSFLLKLIVARFNQYVQSVLNPGTLESTETLVMMGNIGTAKFAGGDNGELTNKIVVSLVNLSEEASLKNSVNAKRANGQHLQMAPVVHVNLYLLFTANFENYEQAIDALFHVLEFFQGAKIFKFKNAPIAGFSDEELEAVHSQELIMEIHTLNFEQINDLWGSLGGKQMPFVLYRARLVPVQMKRPIERSGLITEIDLLPLQDIGV